MVSMTIVWENGMWWVCFNGQKLLPLELPKTAEEVELRKAAKATFSDLLRSITVVPAAEEESTGR